MHFGDWFSSVGFRSGTGSDGREASKRGRWHREFQKGRSKPVREGKSKMGIKKLNSGEKEKDLQCNRAPLLSVYICGRD